MRDVIFVGHAADRTGAPMSLLRLLRWLRERTELDFELLLRTGGELLDDFRSVTRVEVMQPDVAAGRAMAAGNGAARRNPLIRRARAVRRWRRGVRRARAHPPRLLFWNSIASASVVDALLPLPCPVIGRIPECRHAMQTQGLQAVEALCDRSTELVAVSDAVVRDLDQLVPGASKKVHMLPEFVPVSTGRQRPPSHRQRLGIPDDAILVGGVGTLGWRKGTDLFVQLARATLARRSGELHFVWIGDDPEGLRAELLHDLRPDGVERRVHLLPGSDDVSWLYDASDVFALTSREDPLALVALEAAERGLPIVCFRDAGGIAGFVADGAGIAVPYLDVSGMAEAVLQLAADADRRRKLGATGRAKVEREHAVEVVAPRILERIHLHLRRSGAGGPRPAAPTAR